MMDVPKTLDNRPLSWPETLIGLLPFVVFGPLKVWLMYPARFGPENPSWYATSQTQLFGLCLLLGLVVGPLTGWRRWSFPYFCFGVVMVALWVLSLPNRWLYAVVPVREMGPLEQLPVRVAAFSSSVIAFVLLVLGIYFLVHRVSAFQVLGVRVRQDWTQLSFGLYTVATLALSGVDYDEAPVFTVLLILPSIIMFLGALAYLRSTTRTGRIGSLALGLALALGVAIARQLYFVLYGVVLVGIVFLPALFEVARAQDTQYRLR